MSSNASAAAAAAALADPDNLEPFRVAVVGGGLAGAAAASTIASSGDIDSRVTLFDAGFRGVGGRASSRPLLRGGRPEGARGNPTTDHGCQFVIDGGGDPRLTSLLENHAREWRNEGQRFVSLDAETGEVRAKKNGGGEERSGGGEGGDFFGALADGSTIWVGAPTIDSIPKRLLEGRAAARIDVRVGWKVTAVERGREGGKWRVSARAPATAARGPSLPSAGPPSEKEEAVAVVEEEAGLFDAVVLSDASVLRAGSASAVRVAAAAAGPESEASPPSSEAALAPSSAAPLAALARSRRAPLFSVAALLPGPLSRELVPFDVAFVGGKSDVSVLVRESAKPGREEQGKEAGNEVWVAISSREAAAELLALAPPSKGPPPPEALEKAAERLWEAASGALQKAAAATAASKGGDLALAPLALRAQRWGAGVETNADADALFSLDESTLLASCGDVFGKGDAASALLSGVAAGEALLRTAAAEKRKKSVGARSSL